MRTNNSIKNSIAAFVSNAVSIIVGFVFQAIFVNILGTEYLGLNGLFSNIISMLAIAELGIGSAIIYNLYKPIAENDIENINSLMRFYKNCYHTIALIVFIIGICLTPFLSSIIGELSIEINIYIVYFLFLIESVCSYLLSYRRSLLYADQKNSVISIIHIIYLIVLNSVEIIGLLIYKSYYLYLIIKIIMRVLENVLITIICKKNYPFLDVKNAYKLSKTIKNDIIKKTKGLLFHKLGTFLVLGSDNIIISKYLGIVFVGLYSNYQLIITAVTNFLSQIFIATTSSVGNLLVFNNSKKSYLVFQKIRFLNFWLSTFAAISLLIIIDPFIVCWLGSEYLLSKLVLIVLVINFYFKSNRSCINCFKEAAGIFHEDRFVPLLEAFVNIISSIVFLNYFGLAGVFMGTVLSNLVLYLYSYPKYVYKKLFNRSYIDYIKETLGYILLFIFIAAITYGLSLLVKVDNNLLQVIVNTILCLIVPNMLMIIIFRKTDNYHYFKELLFKIINKVFKKIKKAQ